MADSKKPNAPIMVPSNGITLAANVGLISFNAANGGFFLQLYDQRHAPVKDVGAAPLTANFEIGRFMLTPRALRMLEEQLVDAVRAYERAMGVPLKTTAQFNASAALSGLHTLLQTPPVTPEPESDEPQE
jgi:hypothetical protein